MKQILKQKLQIFLAWATRKILEKYKPKIVGITGSVGKTSTKEGVFVVLNQKFRTRSSQKNYNNEFGVPFTVLGVEAPGRSFWGWLGVVVKACSLILFNHRYPEVLVLEMGIDRPGDMDYLVSLAKPDVAVITTIGMSHHEFFSNPGEIENEKGKLVEAVSGNGFVVLNADSESSMRQKSKTQSKVISYGSSGSGADVMLDSCTEALSGKFFSQLVVKYKDDVLEFDIPAIGHTHVSAVMAGIAVGKALGVENSLLKLGVLNYRPAPSRLNIIPGIKHSVIIDDSYNAAPDSMTEALSVLQRMPNTQKIAVLGDMLELGGISDSAHEQVGKEVARLELAHLVTVGESGKVIADAAKTAGMPEDKILSFDSSDEAKKTVQNLLKPEGVVLVKGSQGMRMEKVVTEIMAEPMRASELVCRQYGSWVE